jgi:hypothetical protein
MESYVPCNEAEWPAWFMKHVYTESTSAATPNSLCVSTDNDEWPVIYSLATSKREAKRLIELAIAEAQEGYGY